MSLQFDITVFSDPQGEALARVYVMAVPQSAATPEELMSYRLSGHIVGPTCRYSSTLQSKITFTHRGLTPCGNRTALVAEAVVPDPCYWTTELPFLYRAVGEIIGIPGGATSFDQRFGIRSLGVVHNRIVFNGKIWVPRIASPAFESEPARLDRWRQLDLVMYSDEPSFELLQEASEVGVCLFVDAATSGLSVRWLNSFPAVTLIDVDSDPMALHAARAVSKNALVSRLADGPFDPTPKSDADVLRTMFFEDQTALGMQWAMPAGVPMIVSRPSRVPRTLAAARAACDVLQRDLAGKYDSAGYRV